MDAGEGSCQNSLDCVYPEGHEQAGELIIKSQPPTKSQRVEKMINLIVPESGTVSIGISATAGAGVYISGSLSIISLDSHGNLTGFSPSFGGGALLPGAAEGVAFWTRTNAETVDQLGGWSMAIGGSYELGGSVGYERISFEDSISEQKFSGDSITIGLGGASPIPAEGHVGVNYTWIPVTVNLYDVLSLK